MSACAKNRQPMNRAVRARRVGALLAAAALLSGCAQGAAVGIWFAGLRLPAWSLAKVGDVV